MSRPQMPPDVAAAVGRLSTLEDYRLVRAFVLTEFDRQMALYLGGQPDNTLFVRQGQAQAFDWLVKVLSIGVEADG